MHRMKRAPARSAPTPCVHGHGIGSAAMYKVSSPYETRFLFSRFEAEEEAHPSKELLLAAGGDASATEVAGEV